MTTKDLPVLSFAPDVGDVHVELSTMMASRVLISGDSRSGKSRLVRQMLEQLYGRVPHLVIDPEGDFASLREAFDYLLVGRGGELAADVATAGVLAKRLFQLQANAIVDLSDLKPKPQQDYVAAFVAALMDIHQHEGHLTLVVVDELSRFATEGGRESSHDALWDLSVRGGKRGLCLAAVTHRLGEVSKKVVGGLQNRLIFRTTLDVDVERSGKTLGFRAAAQRDELLHLARGECFAYGPAIDDGAKVFRVRGVEATRTTHFDVTKGARPAPPPARTAIKELVAELRDVAIAAQEERSELEQLRAKVKELAAHPPVSIDPAAIERAVQNAVDAERQRQQRYRDVLQREAEQACARLQAVIAGVDEGWMPPDPAAATLSVAVARPDTRTSVPSMGGAGRTSPTEPAPPKERKQRAPGELAQKQQAMLDALRHHHDNAPMTKAQLGVLVGIAAENRIFRMHLSTLRALGLVEDPDGSNVQLTAAGVERAHSAQAVQTKDELHQLWLRKLTNDKQQTMLRRIILRRGQRTTKRELGELIGVPSENRIFRMHLSVVRKLGILEDTGSEVRASPLLFPEWLP
jgi:hypothetical protein